MTASNSLSSMQRPVLIAGPDEWLRCIHRSLSKVQKARELEPTDAWDHGGAYVLARSLNTVAPGSQALGVLILTAVGAPKVLIDRELVRLSLWRGEQTPWAKRSSKVCVVDKLGDEWATAIATLPPGLIRRNRDSRFGAIYCGPRWWS